jgi:hypothetical protein
MPTTDEIIARWRANAAAAGVRLTDEDIERLRGAAGLGRVLLVEEQLAAIDAWAATPDYLDRRLTEPDGGARG